LQWRTRRRLQRQPPPPRRPGRRGRAGPADLRVLKGREEGVKARLKLLPAEPLCHRCLQHNGGAGVAWRGGAATATAPRRRRASWSHRTPTLPRGGHRAGHGSRPWPAAAQAGVANTSWWCSSSVRTSTIATPCLGSLALLLANLVNLWWPNRIIIYNISGGGGILKYIVGGLVGFFRARRARARGTRAHVRNVPSSVLPK
jgi:hypothetical protein